MRARTGRIERMRTLLAVPALGPSGGASLAVARTAFTRVWNLKSIAIVFYFVYY